MTNRRYFDLKTTKRAPSRYASYITNFAAQERHAALLMTTQTAFWRCQLAAEGLQLVWMADELYEIRPLPKLLPSECP